MIITSNCRLQFTGWSVLCPVLKKEYNDVPDKQRYPNWFACHIRIVLVNRFPGPAGANFYLICRSAELSVAVSPGHSSYYEEDIIRY